MFNLTKEFLYQRYILKNKTLEEISIETGYRSSTIKAHLRRFGIRKTALKLGDKVYDNKDWLYHQYIILNKGYTVIANELGVSYTTILDRILFFGWEKRGHKDIDKGLPRRGKVHSESSIQKIKKTRRKNRTEISCLNCGTKIEKVCSAVIKSQKNFCSYDCYKEFLRKNRVQTVDITDSAEYKEWRKSVYIRDGYRCKMPGCNSITNKIAAHHIYPKKQYPELKFEVLNGITLCKKCHEKTFGKEEIFIDALVRVVQTMND